MTIKGTFAIILVMLGVSPQVMAGERAYVTNQPEGTMSIIDLEQRQEIARIEVPGHAAGVTVDDQAGRVYTVSPDDTYLREWDMDGALCRELQLDGGPIAVAVDAANDRVFVSDWYNAHIFVVDRTSWRIAERLETGSAPSGLDVSLDKNLLVSADRDADQISRFDLATLDPLPTATVGTRPFGIYVDDNGTIFTADVGSNTVTMITDGDTRALAVGERPYGVTTANGYIFSTDQYGDTLSIFDDSGVAIKTLDIAEYPEGIDHSKDEKFVYVANWFANVLSVIDTTTLEVVDEIPTGDGPRAFGRFVGEYKKVACNAQ